jgi:hypothetical protein
VWKLAEELQLDKLFEAGPTVCDDHLMEVFESTRSTNAKRFTRLQWRFWFLLGTVLLLGLQAAMVGVMALAAAPPHG